MKSPPNAEHRPGSEWWLRAAYALVLVEFAGLIYLGSKPEGRGPVWVYMVGPPLLGLAALACALTGVVVGYLRRPFLSRGRLGGWFAVALVIGTASYPFPFPARRTDRPSAVLLDLPVEGEWRVRWGGPDSDRNLPARARPDRRFGYELVPERVAEDPDAPSLAGPSVFAPCDGLVVAMREVGTFDRSELRDGLGNFVVLEIAPGEFLFLASLHTLSPTVAVGDRVQRGAALARAGVSSTFGSLGATLLILFLQDTPEPVWGQGIPFVFGELLVNGVRRERAQPRGQSVRDPKRQPGDVISRVR